MNLLRNTISASALAIALTAASQAHAALILTVDGQPPSTTASNTTSAVNTSVNGWAVNLFVIGADSAAGGVLLDVHNLELVLSTSTLVSPITLTITETNLASLGPAGSFAFNLAFSSTSAQLNSLTRSIYVDPTNLGKQTDLLGSTTDTGSPAASSFTTPANLNGQFSLTEVITVDASVQGAFLSSDDTVRVPEPGSLALLGAGLIGFGWFARRRRKSA